MPRAIHTLQAIRGDIERHRLRREIPQPQRRCLEVFPLEVDHLAGPELPNQLDRLDQSIRTLLPFRPDAGRRFFVQRLARADPEENTAWIELSEGGERLRHDRGMVPEGGAGDAGAERDLPCLRPQAGECDPGVAGVPLVRHPGLRVITGPDGVEAGGLGGTTERDQGRGRELLVREDEADTARRAGRGGGSRRAGGSRRNGGCAAEPRARRCGQPERRSAGHKIAAGDTSGLR